MVYYSFLSKHFKIEQEHKSYLFHEHGSLTDQLYIYICTYIYIYVPRKPEQTALEVPNS